MARVDRVLSAPGGSLLLAGRTGVGRRTAVSVCAHMHRMTLYTPKVSRTYGLKQFRQDLKTIMQQAGIEDEQVRWSQLDAVSRTQFDAAARACALNYISKRCTAAYCVLLLRMSCKLI